MAPLRFSVAIWAALAARAGASEDAASLAGAALLQEKRARETRRAGFQEEGPGTMLLMLRDYVAKKGEGRVALTDVGHMADVASGLRELATNVVEGKEKISDVTRQALVGIVEEMEKIQENCKKIFNENQRSVNNAANTTCELAEDTYAKKVMDMRNGHASCRELEAPLATDRTTKCTDYSNFKASLALPACAKTLAGRTSGFEDGDLACVRELASFATATEAAWTMKNASCANATTLHMKSKDLCDSKQAKFESAFCQYEVELTMRCSNYESCYNEATNSYNSTVEAAKIAEAATKAEFVSAAKIHCFVGVLNASATQQPDMLKKCVDEQPDDSHLTVTYPGPKVGAKLPCDVTPVATKPCDAAWLTAEYESKAWFTAAPAKMCTDCPKPSTTTMAPMAPMTTVPL